MRFFRLVVVGLALIVAVGCAGESTASPLDGVATVVPDPTAVVVEADAGVPDPTAVVEPAAVPTEAPTVVADPTVVPTEVPAVEAEPEPTVAPTSVSEPLTFPPTTEPSAMTDEERAVRDVHTRFMTELLNYDERNGRRGVDPALIEELTTGEQRQVLLDFNAQRELADDFYVVPGYETSIVEVVFNDIRTSAVVRDCGIDTSRLLDAAGTVLEPLTPRSQKLRATRLALGEEGIWTVEFATSGNDESCES